MIRRPIFSALLLCLAAFCFAQERRDPWVFRSVLDKRARMLTISFDNGIWASYDATNCGLYKVWNGSVDFEGAVYTAEHGPQPTSVGSVYEIGLPDKSVWTLKKNGVEVPAVVRYKGYRLFGDTVRLNYEITSGRQKITVSETPIVRSVAGRNPTFTRSFSVSGLGGSDELTLDVNGLFLTLGTLRLPQVNTLVLKNGTSTLSNSYGDAQKPTVPSPMPGPLELFWQEISQVREPGIAMRLYDVGLNMGQLPRLVDGQTPNVSVVIPTLNLNNPDFGGLEDNFYGIFTGFLNIQSPGRYDFRLTSDDGSKFMIRDEIVVDHDGLHSAEGKNGYLDLAVGEHPIRVDYFESGGDAVLKLEWKKPGDTDFSVIPTEALTAQGGEVRVTAPGRKQVLMLGQRSRPGDRSPLEAVHPSYSLSTIEIPGFEPRVGGIDFMGDAMFVCTWDAIGGVYRVDNVVGTVPANATSTRIAAGLAEPLGIKVVNREIYVLQKQELTKLIDHDGDGVTDEYYCVSNGWAVSPNFHEFAFGLVYKNGKFYGNLATAIDPGGRSTRPQAPDRGKVVEIDPKTGDYKFLADGLRTPNGIGLGVGGNIFIADNQGDWLPSSTINILQPNAFFGNYSVAPLGSRDGDYKPPVVWLPQNEIGNSPSQPAMFINGPFKGQMMHGDVTHGGIKRVFVHKVGDTYQGGVVRFTQGLMAGVNRIAYGPDGNLYVGGIGSTGNWAQAGKKWYGLESLSYNGRSAFEMLEVKPKRNGIEITFTEPVDTSMAWDKKLYSVKQWKYVRNEEYGGPKVDETNLTVKSLSYSESGKKLFLEVDGLQEDHVFYVRLHPSLASTSGQGLWATECWYTLNKMPNETGRVSPIQEPAPNKLSSKEADEGFKLLFDGIGLSGWAGWKRENIGNGWSVQNGAMTFTPGSSGGDIRTAEMYASFELRLEWNISEGGNSGIMYRATEDHNYPWETAPEMQVLDDTLHADGANPMTSAGSCYALFASPPGLVRPPGMWNHVRLVVKRNHIEHWLNGQLVCQYEMNSPEWKALIAVSKFKDMPDYGQRSLGYIALQDHGNLVQYRSIRLKVLD